MTRSALHYFVHRRLGFEALEHRHMLATITVTSLADNLAVDGQVTLREAIRAAELNISVDGSAVGSGADTIEFATGLDGAVDLSIVGDTGQGASAFTIATDVTIRGNASGITIQRGGAAVEMRLFRVVAGGKLSLESITLSGGFFRGPNGIAPNGAGGEGRGGAIFSQGTVIITASTLAANEAQGGDGVGSGAGGSGRGGAIYNDGGELSIINATLSGNAAVRGAGTGNVSAFGGGVYSRNGSLSIYNSTITDGTATAGREVYVIAANGTATAAIHSSILAQAAAVHSSQDLIATEDTGGTLIVVGAKNVIRTQNDFDAIAISTADPMLGPLASNGGPTRTHTLWDGSPAIDQGANPLNLSSDQRGGTHARVTGGQADIGAFEVQTTAGPALPGDYNRNNMVDAADFVLWRKTLGGNVALFTGADGNGNGTVDPADYIVWRANFGRSLPATASTAKPAAEAAPAIALASLAADRFTLRPGTKDLAFGQLLAAAAAVPRDLILAVRYAPAAADPEPSTTATANDDRAGTRRSDFGPLDGVWAVWPDRLELV